MGSVTLVKRRGYIEDFSIAKLERSIAAACLSVRTSEGAAEDAARHVRLAVERWLAKKTEVTTNDIRRKTAEALLAFNPEAAYIYKEYREVT